MKHKLELYFWILLVLAISNLATFWYATCKEMRINSQQEKWIEQAVDSASIGTSFSYRGKTLIVREEKR